MGCEGRQRPHRGPGDQCPVPGCGDAFFHMNTLIIKTPSGGLHLVYRYEDGVTSGQLEKDVLIDILSDGKAMFFGPGYEIVNRSKPTSSPPKCKAKCKNGTPC